MLVKRKIGELRVSELRAELEKRKLDSKGLKSALLQRLQKVSFNIFKYELKMTQWHCFHGK